MDMIAAMSGALLILLAFAVGFFLGRGSREQALLPVEPAKPVKHEGEKPKKMEKQDMASKSGVKRGRPRKAPEALQPMQPLHLMKIPGLPKGDYIAIYLVHGGGA